MMRHYLARLLRHHARDLVLLLIAVLLLSLFLSHQNTTVDNGRERDRHKPDGNVGNLNVQDERMRETDKFVRTEERWGHFFRGNGYGRALGLGRGRNILEGMDAVEEGPREDVKERKRKDGGLDGVSQGGETKEKSAIFAHLQKLEEAALERFQNMPKVAVVRGEEDIISRDLPIYQQALEKQGFRVQVEGARSRGPPGDSEPRLLTSNQTDSDWDGWLILLCLALGDADEMGCLKKVSLPRLQAHQKINRIPGLRNVLWRKDAFCYTVNEAHKIPILRRNQLAPLCWVMPAQFDQFLLMADALGSEVRWVFKSPQPGGSIQVLQPNREGDYARIKQFRSQRAVVQQYFPNPLLIFGSPVSIRAYVLVTSLNPLRAYIHSQGLVFFRQDYQKGFSKLPSRSWYLAQFRQYLVHNFGPQVAHTAFRNMETVITETLLVAEPSLVADFAQFSHPWEDPYRCAHCFQLLGFDVIFNSTLHPIVVEVSGQPHFPDSTTDQQWAQDGIQQTTVEESMSMLFSISRVAKGVASVLEMLPMQIELQGLGCSADDEICLTDEDLEGLLSARREQLNMGSFRQLYPSPDIEKYTPLLEELGRFTSSHFKLPDSASPHHQHHPHHHPEEDSSTPPLPAPPTRHSTQELHPVLAAMGQRYLQEERGALRPIEGSEGGAEEAEGERTSEVGVPSQGGGLVRNVFGLNRLGRGSNMKGPGCSEDRDTLPYLAALHTYPSLNLTFDPRTTEYHAEVAYEQVILQVGAFAMSCGCEARLEDKFGLSRPANFTLGLGETRINIYIVDITHSEPWVLNAYSLHIIRTHTQTSLPSLGLAERYAVCTIVQDCDLLFLPSYSCGLRLLPGVNWSEVVTKAISLPICSSGDAPGQWLVPCGQCTDERSCDWDRARWQPHDCRHQEFGQSEVKECLAGKKLLFIGDSTNRGIMYYLMERVNGSLYEWDKTHSTKLYTDLNAGHTSFSFSYYPQFWLAAQDRPVFDQTLHQVMRGAGVLRNDTNTVVVVGGVHWLAAHHLTELLYALERAGLTGAQKIIKGLGAGFHQAVDGIHCLTLAEQRKAYLHNQVLREVAGQLGCDFVDTFNMTTARYRDFLEGKCACHFHKVEEMFSPRPPEGSSHSSEPTNRVKAEGIGSGDHRYHVTGRINAAYSDIVLSQICGRGRR